MGPTGVLAVLWLLLGLWCIGQVADAAVADTEFSHWVIVGVLIEIAVAVWLISWPFMAYQLWALTLVASSDGPAWCARLLGGDAKLLRAAAQQPDASGQEHLGRAFYYVFTLTPSAIVFWAVQSRRLRPVFVLPVNSIEWVWRRDFQPASTYVSFVGMDPKRFIGLSPSRGRFWRLIRDREDGFRAISQLVGPAKVRRTEVQRSAKVLREGDEDNGV